MSKKYVNPLLFIFLRVKKSLIMRVKGLTPVIYVSEVDLDSKQHEVADHVPSL